MKRINIFFLGILIILSITACKQMENKNAAATVENTQSAKESLDKTLASLKVLDMDTFNAYSDNQYKSIWEEYQIFSGLMKKGNQKETEKNRKFAEEVMQDFSWEIGEETIKGKKAEIKVVLKNRDMTDVIGNYTIDILSNIFVAEQNIKENYDLYDYIVAQNGTEYIQEVTMALQKQNDRWILLLNDEVINAIMGNINTEQYSPEVEQKLKEQEDRIEQETNQIIEQI